MPGIVGVPARIQRPLDGRAGDGFATTLTSMRGASHLFLLLAGYAVLENATIPIIGDWRNGKQQFVEQLTAGAKAAIDKAAELGVVDPAESELWDTVRRLHDCENAGTPHRYLSAPGWLAAALTTER